jgi:hypothetical protein
MPDRNATPLRIFLSYSTQQADVAKELYLSLRQSGHHVFFDRTSLPAGEEYDRAIAYAVRSSDRFIFLLSPQSLRDGAYTLSELRFAEEAWPTPAGRVLPVLAVPMEFCEIPGYLKAVTVFRPRGNLVAEVTAEINWQAAGMAPGETVAGHMRGIGAELDRQSVERRLAEIDRQWDNEKRQYMVTINGQPSNIPVTRKTMLIPFMGSLGLSLFGYMNFTRPNPEFFGWAPTLMVWLVGIPLIIYTWLQARGYREGEAEYRRKRREVLREIEESSDRFCRRR